MKPHPLLSLTVCLILMSIAAFGPTVLSPLITFGAYSIMRMVSHESSFSVTTAVTSLSILNLITTPARQLLLAIPLGLQAIGSFDRIQSFLQLVETPISTATSSSNDIEESLAREKSAGPDPILSAQHSLHEPMICVKSVARGDDVTRHGPVAAQAICFTPNSLTAITGPIGCGKSTVLKGLLSEEAQEVCPFPSKDIAYCGQTPWIHDGTVRDNIIGQSELDNLWYKDVICSCELDVDISRMPEGDATVVGSRGLRLSGGQRQRIVSETVNLDQLTESNPRCSTLTNISPLLEPYTLRRGESFLTTSQALLMAAHCVLWQRRSSAKMAYFARKELP
jgi:ATP-binding cassette subfamily C (CFTR/MRP) protein 1